eukprot:COSAG04_NODE_13536_length_602_cov_0.662028_1_plen_189_part_10
MVTVAVRYGSSRHSACAPDGSLHEEAIDPSASAGSRGHCAAHCAPSHRPTSRQTHANTVRYMSQDRGSFGVSRTGGLGIVGGGGRRTNGDGRAVSRHDQRHRRRDGIALRVGGLDLVAQRLRAGVREHDSQRRAGAEAVGQVDGLEVGVPERLRVVLLVVLQVRAQVELRLGRRAAARSPWLPAKSNI